jgi:hypothetical protein
MILFSFSEFRGMRRLVSGPSTVSVVIQFVIFAGTAYTICKPAIREVYKVDRKKMINTIVISAILVIVTMVMFY